MVLGSADNLIILMSLACQQDNIARMCKADRQSDCVVTVFDNHEPFIRETFCKLIASILTDAEWRDSGFNLLQNRQRLLGAWIVGSDDGKVAHAGSDSPHDRAFAVVAISAASEQGDDSPGGNFLQCGKDILKGVPGMGVINETGDSVAVFYPLHAPRHGGVVLYALFDRLKRQIKGDSGCSGSQYVGEIEAPQQPRGRYQILPRV